MDSIIQIRKFRINKIYNSDEAKNLEKKLSNINGVLSAKVDSTGLVKLEYNIKSVKFDTIEKFLAFTGFDFKNKFWTKIRTYFWTFTEENELDNLQHTPHCCSETPVKEK